MWTMYDAQGRAKEQGASGGTPAVVLGSAAASGVSPLFTRIDDTIRAFDGTTPPAIAAAGSAGTTAFTARSDHTHTIGTGIITRAMLGTDAKDWIFLGSATGATVTVGPVIWTAAVQQLLIKYIIKGYNGGTPVGRILLGSASISTTALTNGSNIVETATGVAQATSTSAPSIPGCPLAVTLSAIARAGTIFIDGASGSLKTYEVYGQNGNPAVATPPSIFRAAGSFSDLGTNLALLRAQLTVYDTLIAVAASAQTFTTGTYLSVWGRNTD